MHRGKEPRQGRAFTDAGLGLQDLVRRGTEQLTDTVGGPARRKAILLLAAVLSLSGADVGAVAPWPRSSNRPCGSATPGSGCW